MMMEAVGEKVPRKDLQVVMRTRKRSVYTIFIVEFLLVGQDLFYNTDKLIKDKSMH
jgi:hypothetical protein